VSSRTWPRPRGASRTKSSGLGLGLDNKVLGLGLGLEIKVLGQNVYSNKFYLLLTVTVWAQNGKGVEH